MSTAAAIREIEENIKEAQKFTELGNALDRLRTNRDFKRIISEGYFEKEAVRLVHLKSDMNMQTPERQASIMAQIDAIGLLNQYFETVYFRARQATKAIADDEATIEELRDEGDE